MQSTSAPTQLGFLTLLHEPSGYLGGYLVTNLWGRPLEFRLSTAVQPNRVQQILYGFTLTDYIYAEVIARTLVEKTTAAASVIFADQLAVLDLRNHINIPVVWIADDESQPEEKGIVVRSAGDKRPALVTHRQFAGDVPRIGEIADQLGRLDLLEPFTRIRDAIAEARKLGVTSRAG